VKVVLDTNIYFALLYTPGYLDRYRETVHRLGPRLHLSSVVRSELLRGARGDSGRRAVARALRGLERAGRTVAPTHEDWIAAGRVQGEIWDEHPELRSKILQNDILIICSARRAGALIVTENLADFAIVRGYLPHTAVSIAQLTAQLSP
jgi:predicted nucleic acid-binding protein